jgi:hypothetical protein
LASIVVSQADLKSHWCAKRSGRPDIAAYESDAEATKLRRRREIILAIASECGQSSPPNSLQGA